MPLIGMGELTALNATVQSLEDRWDVVVEKIATRCKALTMRKTKRSEGARRRGKCR
jgi:hypothetical protein